MDQPRLAISILELPRYTKVSVEGRLDSETAPEFESRIRGVLDRKTRNILLDFEKLNYISSAGLRVVTSALKTARTYKGYVQLARMQPQIKRVFDIVGLVPPNQIFASLEELDAYLDRMQTGDA